MRISRALAALTVGAVAGLTTLLAATPAAASGFYYTWDVPSDYSPPLFLNDGVYANTLVAGEAKPIEVTISNYDDFSAVDFTVSLGSSSCAVSVESHADGVCTVFVDPITAAQAGEGQWIGELTVIQTDDPTTASHTEIQLATVSTVDVTITATVDASSAPMPSDMLLPIFMSSPGGQPAICAADGSQTPFGEPDPPVWMSASLDIPQGESLTVQVPAGLEFSILDGTGYAYERPPVGYRWHYFGEQPTTFAAGCDPVSAEVTFGIDALDGGVYFSTVDEGGKPIGGGVFVLTHPDGTTTKHSEYGDSQIPGKFSANLPVHGEYTLTQTVATEGYALAAPVTFTVTPEALDFRFTFVNPKIVVAKPVAPVERQLAETGPHDEAGPLTAAACTLILLGVVLIARSRRAERA